MGCDISTMRYAQSKADFINKLEIALKECYETEYWLEILYKVKSIDESSVKERITKCLKSLLALFLLVVCFLVHWQVAP